MKFLAQILVACTIVEAVQSLRPGASWNLRGNTVAGLEWTDKTQTIPLAADVSSWITQCKADETARNTVKAQARLDVKNASLTQTQRLQALLILLDYDK